MKVKVSHKDFARSLSYVSKAISSKPSIPVLSNVLIESSDTSLELSTTDLEFGISTKMAAEVTKSGKTTVDARTLSDFVNSLSTGNLVIELKDKILKIESKKNNANFNIVSAEEFPQLPQSGKVQDFDIDAMLFVKAVNKVIFSAASDDSRPILTGVLFEIKNSHLQMVAVDGFRLSKKIIEIKSRKKGKEIEKNPTYIVPAKVLGEVARISSDLCEEKDNVEIYILKSKNQMLFKIKDVEISTRLIEGEFPEYKQILPKQVGLKFSVDKEDLGRVVKTVGIFARYAVGNKAVFEIIPSENILKLSAQAADVGTNESIVEIHDIEGEGLKMGFNIGYLNDMINALEGDEVCFEINGVTAPGVFKDKPDKDFLHIIMPMRLD